MKWSRSILAFAVGLCALLIFWGEHQTYQRFLPLHGYRPINAHIMDAYEGLFLGLYLILGAIAVFGLALGCFSSFKFSLSQVISKISERFSARLWVCVLAIFSAMAAWSVGFGLLDGAFLTDDEMAMLFQARLLQHGQIWAEPTPFPEVFRYAMIVGSPRWYGIYPIGHPALMAVSLFLSGNERTIFGLVAAALVVLTYLLARKLYDKPTALLAATFLAFSPFFVMTAGSLAGQMTSGFFLLAALNVIVRVEERNPWLTSIGLGLIIGAAYLSRPYTTLAMGIPFGLWIAWLWFCRKIPLWFPVVAVIFALPFVVGYLWMNAELTGSPWLTPYEALFPGKFRIGFGQDAFGVIHTPAMAAAIVGLTLFELNAWVLGWPLSLVPICGAFLFDRPSGKTILLMAIPVVVLLAYMPVPMAGVHDTGPLYYFEILPVLVVLAAFGCLSIAKRVAPFFDGRGKDLVAWFALSATIVGALIFWPQQISVLDDLSEFNNAPYDIAEEMIEGRAIVFVDTVQSRPPSSWVLGARPPRHDLSDRIVYCYAVRREKVLEVLGWARGRRAYFLSRDQSTGAVSLLPLPFTP